MSLKSTLGTSLTEVMVMMVILGISLVGIYSMVNSGQQLATLTDTRLSAINIGREGLESVATLRDTFALKGYESGSCGVSISAFFSIDKGILVDTPAINCPEVGGEKYILQDDKTLLEKGPVENFDVCINEFGWYSQEFSAIGANTLSACRASPGTSGCVPCSSTVTRCGGNVTQSCKTRFEREITFASDLSSGCGTINDPEFCVEVISKVSWGDESDENLELTQIMTSLD